MSLTVLHAPMFMRQVVHCVTSDSCALIVLHAIKSCECVTCYALIVLHAINSCECVTRF